jgi:hypothetical protein
LIVAGTELHLYDEIPALDDRAEPPAAGPKTWYVADEAGPYHVSTRLDREAARWGTVLCEVQSRDRAGSWRFVQDTKPIGYGDERLCEECRRVIGV